MEDVKVMFNKANELIKRADHMFYITYPLIKDNKLIIAIAENISNGMIYAMDAILMYERNYKRISLYPDDFNIKLSIFRNEVAKRYNIDRSHIEVMQNLKIFLDERRRSKMEFTKNDKYFLFNQKQELKSLGIDRLKQNLNISKGFLVRVGDILTNVRT